MRINTRHFGEVELKEDKIITFPAGLMAFNEVKDFFIINNNDREIPFDWLQAVEDSQLAFVIINPFLFKSDYEFDIPQEVMEELDIQGKEDVMVFSIVVVPEDIKKVTANLLAPLVINPRNRKGKQIVLHDKRYSTKHYILEELKNNDRGGK